MFHIMLISLSQLLEGYQHKTKVTNRKERVNQSSVLKFCSFSLFLITKKKNFFQIIVMAHCTGVAGLPSLVHYVCFDPLRPSHNFSVMLG